MASSMRISRTLRSAASVIRHGTRRADSWQLSSITKSNLAATAGTYPRSVPTASFHTTPRRLGDGGRATTDFSKLDVLGGVPVPAHSVDICMSNGFQFNNGGKILDGSGVIVVNGEAFAWRPWVAHGEKRLLNQKRQFEVTNETLGLFELIWPRPDILVLGLGPKRCHISPDLSKYIKNLGMRIEVLNTRNAASHFNLLVAERGISDIAAALIPMGWKEGVGAS